jgi:hypothetical protein
MPTKQGNKTIHGNKIIQGKSHENHKYNQRKATIQGNKYIKKKKKHTLIVHKPRTENGKDIGSSSWWRRGKRSNSRQWAANRRSLILLRSLFLLLPFLPG